MIKRSEVENGSYEQWDYTNSYENGKSDVFVQQYFAPYINMKKVKQQKNNCFAGSPQNSPFCMWKTPTGEFDAEGCWTVSPKYTLKDGRDVAIMVHHILLSNADGSPRGYWDFVDFVVDVNGKRGKSIMGYDVFTFSLLNYLRYGNSGKSVKGFHMGLGQTDGDFAESTENIKRACTHSNVGGLHKCGLLIQRNGWKFPKDYPLKF